MTMVAGSAAYVSKLHMFARTDEHDSQMGARLIQELEDPSLSPEHSYEPEVDQPEQEIPCEKYPEGKNKDTNCACAVM